MPRNQPTSTGRTENLLIPAGEWKMFPIPTEELLPSLLGNILLKTFPIPTGKLFRFLLGKISPSHCGKCFPSLLGNVFHPYWEMFAIPTGKRFPSILGNISLPAGKLFPSLLGKVPSLSWERFPILTGKHIPYSGEPFSPLWLGNIYPSQWDIVLITSGKYLLILLGNVPFSLFNMSILSTFCNSWQTAWILQRINSSQKGSKRETFPGWLSTNYEKYSPLLWFLLYLLSRPTFQFTPFQSDLDISWVSHS